MKVFKWTFHFTHRNVITQGWTGKIQPGLTHLVKPDLNHPEKPNKVGKLGFINFSPRFLCYSQSFFEKNGKTHQKDVKTHFTLGLTGVAKHQLSILCKIIF